MGFKVTDRNTKPIFGCRCEKQKRRTQDVNLITAINANVRIVSMEVGTILLTLRP